MSRVLWSIHRLRHDNLMVPACVHVGLERKGNVPYHCLKCLIEVAATFLEAAATEKHKCPRNSHTVHDDSEDERCFRRALWETPEIGMSSEGSRTRLP